MADMKLGENVTEGVKAKLQAGWQTRADRINSQWGDDIVIAAPATDHFFGGRVQELPGCPACFVMEGQTTFQGEGSSSLISSPEVLVYIADEDFNGPRLAKRLQRQVRAVIECVYADAPVKQVVSVGPFAGEAQNSIFQVFPVRTVPGTVFQPSAEESWRGIYTVVFRAQQDEGPY
jgi:hypothetical protein